MLERAGATVIREVTDETPDVDFDLSVDALNRESILGMLQVEA